MVAGGGSGPQEPTIAPTELTVESIIKIKLLMKYQHLLSFHIDWACDQHIPYHEKNNYEYGINIESFQLRLAKNKTKHERNIYFLKEPIKILIFIYFLTRAEYFPN